MVTGVAGDIMSTLGGLSSSSSASSSYEISDISSSYSSSIENPSYEIKDQFANPDYDYDPSLLTDSYSSQQAADYYGTNLGLSNPSSSYGAPSTHPGPYQAPSSPDSYGAPKAPPSSFGSLSNLCIN